MSANTSPFLEELGLLAQFLPERIELWGGGAALSAAGHERLPGRLKLLPDLGAFERELTLLTARAPN